jgi:hypothetical protein
MDETVVDTALAAFERVVPPPGGAI